MFCLNSILHYILYACCFVFVQQGGVPTLVVLRLALRLLLLPQHHTPCPFRLTRCVAIGRAAWVLPPLLGPPLLPFYWPIVAMWAAAVGARAAACGQAGLRHFRFAVTHFWSGHIHNGLVPWLNQSGNAIHPCAHTTAVLFQSLLFCPFEVRSAGYIWHILISWSLAMFTLLAIPFCFFHFFSFFGQLSLIPFLWFLDIAVYQPNIDVAAIDNLLPPVCV